jgi:hypothetical protein
VLDAGICITHILASSSMVGAAFYHFMWISILKLLIFCLLEMRLIISIYQGRSAAAYCCQSVSQSATTTILLVVSAIAKYSY